MRLSRGSTGISILQNHTQGLGGRITSVHPHWSFVSCWKSGERENIFQGKSQNCIWQVAQLMLLAKAAIINLVGPSTEAFLLSLVKLNSLSTVFRQMSKKLSLGTSKMVKRIVPNTLVEYLPILPSSTWLGTCGLRSHI